MRLNGELQVLLGLEGGGLDEDGAPREAQEVWSECVPCHVKTNTDNELGTYEDGLFHKAEYQVLAEPWAGEGILALDTEVKRVRLTRRGKSLGEFPVMSIQRIDTQNRFVILV